MNSNQLVPTNQITDIVEVDATPQLPAFNMEALKARYKAMKQFVRENMRLGTDYGTIPGAGERRTLLKPGAEKLCTLFDLSATFVGVEIIQDWEKPFFAYRYLCRLSTRRGMVISEAEGACNSYEKKYRWRSIYKNSASRADIERAHHTESRSAKGGGTYEVLIVENDDPYTLVNTLIKMAMKRALVAAVLIAANASDYFTTDDEGDAEPERQAPLDDDKQPVNHGAASSEKPSTAVLSLSFVERPSQDILARVKAAGFTWDKVQMVWRAEANEERNRLRHELAEYGLLK